MPQQWLWEQLIFSFFNAPEVKNKKPGMDGRNSMPGLITREWKRCLQEGHMILSDCTKQQTAECQTRTVCVFCSVRASSTKDVLLYMSFFGKRLKSGNINRRLHPYNTMSAEKKLPYRSAKVLRWRIALKNLFGIPHTHHFLKKKLYAFLRNEVGVEKAIIRKRQL